MVNLHFSLLPRWRGAAPVERAILAGDERTGVDLMAVEEGLDTGGIYDRVEVPIGPDEHGRRAARPARRRWARELLVADLRDGLGEPAPQVGEPTYADKLDAGRAGSSTGPRPAVDVHRLVRLGGAWTTHDGAPAQGVAHRARAPTGPGDVARVADRRRAVELVEVQPEGKAPDARRAPGPTASRRPGAGLGTDRRPAAAPEAGPA